MSAADLGRVLFEPLAEDIAVANGLNHRGFMPYGCLKEFVCHDRPTILTFGVMASAIPDSLHPRPRLTSPASNSDEALSFTLITAIMRMWCNKSRSTSGSSNPVMVREFSQL